MKVVVHAPTPPPPPPKTYDITGLTAGEFKLIRHALGKTTYPDAHDCGLTGDASSDLWKELTKVSVR